MKTTKFIAIIVLLCGLGACTKNNFIDTGICNGRFDGSLLEYLEAPANSYNWDSTALMVYRAGDDVVRLFEGKIQIILKLPFWASRIIAFGVICWSGD